MAIALESFILSECPGADSLDENDLLRLWNKCAEDLKLNPKSGEKVVVEVARDATGLAAGDVDAAFGGGWRWSLTDGATRTLLASVLLIGALSAAGVTGLTPLVVPAVIPLLFDLQRVRLNRKNERVLEIFGARSEAFARKGTAAELYALLPAEVRVSLDILEFQEFLDSAVLAGRATETDGGFEVLPNGESVLKITIV